MRSPKQLSNARVSVFDLNSSGPIEALATVQLDSTGGIVSGGAGGSTDVVIKDSSGVFFAGSTGAPPTGAQGLVVRQVDYSTTVNISSVAGRVLADQNSTVWSVQADGRLRAQNSTIGDLLASVQQNSTVWAVQVDGRVRAQNSTIGDLLASVQQNSTVWQTQAALRTSSGAGIEGSTTTPSTGSVLGLHVRAVQPSGRQSTSLLANIGTAGGSTLLISSVAGVKHKCYAYAVTSTVTAISSIAFVSSAASERWGLLLGSGSSGITGANLAVAPPGFLFETDVANALNFTASSTGLYRVSLAWFTEA